jgi:WD40 repeat protein
MSDGKPVGEQGDSEPPPGKTFIFEDQILTEIEVDENPPDDDDSTVWTDTGDNVEETEQDAEVYENVVDMSLFQFKGHSDSVYSIAIHPINPNIVITGGGDDMAYIWKYSFACESADMTDTLLEPAASKNCFELSGHTDTVTTVGFNHDGTLALTGGYDGKVRVWNVETGSLVVVLEGPGDIEWAEWHSVGNAILAGSSDGTAWMWLVPSGQCVQVLAGHDGSVSSGCFTRDGKLICTGGEDGTIRVWLPRSGACKHLFRGERDGHEAMVTALASSADADLLLSGIDCLTH